MNAEKRERTGTVALDLAKIELALQKLGLTWTSPKPRCDVSRATWYRLSQGKRVSKSTASAIAEYLEFEITELLRSTQSERGAHFAWPEHPEWEIVEGSEPWNQTSNGLYFFRCKVRHKHLSTETQPEYGRARVYDLSRVPDEKRERMRDQLTRHSLVSRKLSYCPYFMRNLSVAPVANGALWWVVDQWVEGETLREQLASKSLELVELGAIMKAVAEALEVLHRTGVILRELSPERIFVAADGVRLIELDLARLLDGSKTVSGEWPTDPFRAPEVDSGDATPQADFYSWSMVYLYAATGDFIFDELQNVQLRRELKRVLGDCLSPMQSKRPQSAEKLVELFKEAGS